MSPVLRVLGREAPDNPHTPVVPSRVRLDLAELVLAARLAGGVPLPVHVGDDGDHRLTDRLSGTPLGQAREVLDAALARVDDEGPAGARAALAERDLLDDSGLDPAVGTALAVLAGAPLGLLLDVSAVRAGGTVRLRSWFGVEAGVVVQLSTADGLDYELAWFDPALWVSQVARAVTVEPWAASAAPATLPDYVSLPSELLAGSERAHRERRGDLLPGLATAAAGRVRLGEPGEVEVATPEETLAVLSTLATACRGRLRLVSLRRDTQAPPGVASWVLLDDGWHELRPGRDATTVLQRREARDLGLVSLPLVTAVARPGGDAEGER
ncbi:MAG: hypothetical protein ACXVEJ_12670 [Nocardioides sp.]